VKWSAWNHVDDGSGSVGQRAAGLIDDQAHTYWQAVTLWLEDPACVLTAPGTGEATARESDGGRSLDEVAFRFGGCASNLQGVESGAEHFKDTYAEGEKWSRYLLWAASAAAAIATLLKFRARGKSGRGDRSGRKRSRPSTRFGPKFEKQLSKRGWTKELVEESIEKPARTVRTRDTRHLPDGGRMDDPATAYYSERGGYVVRNDRTGDIVQVSNRNDPGWRAPWD